MSTKFVRNISIVAVMSLTMAIALVACGSDPTPTPKPAAPAAAAPTATPVPATDNSSAAPAPTATPVPAAPEFDAEGYFKGKTIRMMVGYNPGGGTDAQARFMSRAWPKFIPGNPRIVVTNMTPNVTQRNFVWNSKADGLTLSVEATAGIYDQNSPSAEFDMREVSMVGVTSGKDQFWMTLGTTGYGCLETAFNATGPTLTVGTSAPTPADLGSVVAIPWMADQFNIPLEIKNVAAAGSAEQYLMLERGDVNSWTSSTVWNQLPITRPGWVESGFLKPFADMSFPGFFLEPNSEGEYGCPKVESFFDKDDQLPTWLAITGPRTYASKNIIGPPGMAEGPLNALRAALEAAMSDEGYAADQVRFTGIPNNFTPGAQAQKELRETTQAFIDNASKIDDISKAAFEKYVK